MVEPIGVLMAMLLLRRRLRTRHRIAISVLRSDDFFLLLLLLLLLRLLWRLLQRFSLRYWINRAESSYERCFLMFVRPVMIVPGMIMMVVVVVTRVIVMMMMVMMTVRQ